MKKFLLLFILSLIRLNAYEYLIYNQPQSSYIFQRDLTNGNSILQVKLYYKNGRIEYSDDLYTPLDAIKFHNHSGNQYYIRKFEFDDYLKNDLNLLNDFYIQRINPFLNYLYNEYNFDSSNYIVYENYELLYNSDGLAVASVLNGQWAGLYDNSTMGNSGNLYNSSGSLIYVDGQEPSFFQKLWVKLSEPLLKDFMDANSGLIPLRWIVAFIIIFMLVYFIIRLYKNALGVEKWKI